MHQIVVGETGDKVDKVVYFGELLRRSVRLDSHSVELGSDRNSGEIRVEMGHAVGRLFKKLKSSLVNLKARANLQRIYC